MNPQRIAVYGAGGFAREVAWLAESCSQPQCANEVCCFIDDNAANHGKLLNEIPVVSLTDACQKWPDAKVVVAVGNPSTREAMVAQAARAGFGFATLVHPQTPMSRWIAMEEGAVICAGSILTTNIVLGRHVQINLDCTIGHDVIMGDFATLAPGVHISGAVHIGKRVYLGTGAVVINGTADAPLVIEDDVVIGAGACVTKSLEANKTYVGIPARAR